MHRHPLCVEGVTLGGTICEWASAPPAIAPVTKTGALRVSSPAGNLPSPGDLRRPCGREALGLTLPTRYKESQVWRYTL
jgi:hypothetical protein